MKTIEINVLFNDFHSMLLKDLQYLNIIEFKNSLKNQLEKTGLFKWGKIMCVKSANFLKYEWYIVFM